MPEHRYGLQDYKGMASRYHCPECRQKGKFARYIDKTTGEQLGDNVGKCERADKCGYHVRPSEYFKANGIVPNHNTDVSASREIVPERPASLIDSSLMDRSKSDFENNNFVIYLKTLFPEATVNHLIDKYKIGTSKHWPGSTVFWQMDVAGNIRTGKIMQYDSATGKRVKVPQERIQWVHKVTKAKDFNLKQCLFGEHLLFSNNLPIAVTESEKTAIIASGYLPQFTWVAAGNKQGLSVDKCKALKENSKTVVLYPDLNAFEDWKDKAKLYGFKVSDLLEKKATAQEKESGLDLADYLIQFDINDFLSTSTAKQPDKGFSTIIQDKELSAESTKEDLNTITTRLKLTIAPQPEEEQVNRLPIPADVVTLQQFYGDLEDNGLIPDEHRNYIGTLFQGIMIYLKNPIQLMLYTEPLEKLKTEIEFLNKQQIAI